MDKESNVFVIKDIWTWFDENNKFLNKSNMHDYKVKLMKLTFFAIEFYKAYTGNALVNEKFEAWREGPVSNKAYAQISQDDRSSEMEKFSMYPKVEKILNDINNIFGIYSANALSECSHLLDSWKRYYKEKDGKPIMHITIPDSELDAEFNELIKNLDYFYKFDETQECACIIGDKTVIYNKENERDFELNYEKIFTEVSNPNKFIDDNLIFLDFDGDQVHYEL